MTLFEAQKPEPIKLDGLLLDPDNPRLELWTEIAIWNQVAIVQAQQALELTD